MQGFEAVDVPMKLPGWQWNSNLHPLWLAPILHEYMGVCGMRARLGKEIAAE